LVDIALESVWRVLMHLLPLWYLRIGQTYNTKRWEVTDCANGYDVEGVLRGAGC
ncbi:hypothetical protein NEUTE2DRAFT_57393, partial [Neurospora tetrasperma FGSC 2509]